MEKIDSKITSYKVLSDADKQPQQAVLAPPMVREDVLLGQTYKVKSPLSTSAMYVTINDIVVDNRRYAYEIFINTKNVDHFEWMMALTKVISAVFRLSIGRDVSFLAKELQDVFSPKGGYMKKGGYVNSIINEIGDAIAKHLQDIERNPL